MAPAEWTMSIEVAEHIPPEKEAVFLFNALKLAKNGTVLSWAGLRQAGHHHVNRRTNAYVQAKLGCAGFFFQVEQTRLLRDAVDACPWLRRTVMVFRKKSRSIHSACGSVP